MDKAAYADVRSDAADERGDGQHAEALSPARCGLVNGTGTVVMRAERVGSETLLARIVQMVGEAQRTRAPIQRLADRVSAWFVPAVVGIAVLTFIGWSLWAPEPRLAYGLVNAVAVLIIACPYALGLTTPMSIMVGTGRGALVGVLLKNVEALERMEQIDTLIVDKTGTLTEGRPRLTVVKAASGHGEASVLRLAASFERGSEHPLAAAILAGATERGMAITAAEEFRSVAGKGVVGRIAMGTGTDVAIESAGVTLVKGDLRGAVRARHLSRATMQHSPEPVLRLRLQRARRSHCCGSAVSRLRDPAEPDHR